ncbi:MAG: DUF3306 domain-containing protein [Pseudomonadota bacterium]
MTARDTPDKDGFLTRWSRRKRGAETQDHDEASQTAEALPADGGDAQLPADPERAEELAANRAAAEAVDLEAIDYESDLSVFFKEGVPAVLKQAALRKMWRSDPVFANLDGLNDYDQDFNVIDKVLTEFKSAWQVGRGYASQDDEAVSTEGSYTEEAAAVGADDHGCVIDEDARKPSEDPSAETGRPMDGGDVGETSLAGAADSPPRAHIEPDDAPENTVGTPQEEAPRPAVSLRRRMQLFDDG